MTVATMIPDEPTTMTRNITLAVPADETALMRLAGGEGVYEVRTSSDRRQVQITYDVRRTGMAALERWAASVGLEPSHHLIDRAQRAWAAFQDDNLRSQAKIVHHCCSAPIDDVQH